MDRLIVSPSPHQKSNMSTQGIMLCVLVSLLPAVVASGIIFGLKAILVILTCVSSSLIFEYGCRLIMKKKQTISDLSAAVTGVILSLNLPATIPLWQAIIGSFIAIVIVKQLFGGLGQNFANPAITARIVLMLSFTSSMTTWVEPFFYKKNDIVSSATPLVKEWVNGQSPFSYKELFLGTTGGCIGETCALALLIGGLYLIIRRIILTSNACCIYSVFCCTPRLDFRWRCPLSAPFRWTDSGASSWQPTMSPPLLQTRADSSSVSARSYHLLDKTVWQLP